MNKEELLTYFNEDIINKGHYYTYQNIPRQIGNAIYLYGSYTVFDIIVFIDLSQECDGSLGMIITPEGIYFQLNQKGYLPFQDIQNLSLEKHRQQDKKAIIRTSTANYQLNDEYIDIEKFISNLSALTNISVDLVMTKHELIEHYITLVLHDLENDEYEDVELTDQQLKQMKELYENIHIIQSLDEQNYQYELETLLNQAIQFFDELELDSDEIDNLIHIQEELQQKQDQAFDQAKQYYDDMMHQYQQGNTKMYDQLKSMMNMLGINEDELKNKSPEEMNQYIDNLCARFGISRSQIDKFTKRFQK